MSSRPPSLRLPSIEQERFGIKVARVLLESLDALPSVLESCRDNQVGLLIARCRTSDLEVAQAMEREGFLLMDTLLYYARDLVRTPIPSQTGEVAVRPIQPGEEDRVTGVAAAAFRGYSSHYHADKRLDPAKCDEAYVSWAHRSCVYPDVADAVLVATLKDETLGFLTLRVSNPGEGEGILLAVAPPAQGQGVSSALMIEGMKWCLAQGATRMLISTQITNLSSQRSWTRLGFEVSHAYYTFHKWFD